ELKALQSESSKQSVDQQKRQHIKNHLSSKVYSISDVYRWIDDKGTDETFYDQLLEQDGSLNQEALDSLTELLQKENPHYMKDSKESSLIPSMRDKTMFDTPTVTKDHLEKAKST